MHVGVALIIARLRQVRYPLTSHRLAVPVLCAEIFVYMYMSIHIYIWTYTHLYADVQLILGRPPSFEITPNIPPTSHTI